jgi:hypothetical protein
MRSRPFRPIGLPIYVARVPAAPFARCPTRSLAPTPRHFTLITRTARARASYLAALPSTRAIETRSLPTSLAAIPLRLCLLCRFPQKLHSLNRDVFYVTDPISFIDQSHIGIGDSS